MSCDRNSTIMPCQNKTLCTFKRKFATPVPWKDLLEKDNRIQDLCYVIKVQASKHESMF